MKQQKQSGFAHIGIVVIVLTIALIGTLSFVFWQNFIAEKDNKAVKTPETGQTNNKISDIIYKKYTDDVYGASFEYPETWSLGPLEALEPGGDPHYNRRIAVKNENSEVVANLTLGVSGIGGTCMGEDGKEVLSNYIVLDVAPSDIKAKNPVFASFHVTQNYQGVGYNAAYGLNSTMTEVREYNLCMFWLLFESNIINSYGSGYLISFGGSTKEFTSLDDAKKYVNSDEYKEIKKMILTLKY